MKKSVAFKVRTIILLTIFLTGTGRSSSLCASPGGGEEADSVKKTIPYTLPWDDMPIDLSFVYKAEKPAGKHGFLKAAGERFIFEDGTEARFWGTNFNSAQCFPSHEQSEKVARRLAKTGINMVRFHQLDGEWSTPNIFQFTRGENRPNTLTLDARSMDRLDYLIHCLKQEGIYVYMDLLTYRRFETGDGVEAAGQLRDAAKPYSTFSRRLIDLQKKFSHDLWTHINPYTGLAYKDDPVIALVEVTNENDIFSGASLEPYRTELETLYRKWAADNHIRIPEGKVEFGRADRERFVQTGEAHHLQRFYVAVTRSYYKEMMQHMRELGVKIPIAGTNETINTAHLTAQMEGDFTDSHAYYYSFGLWYDGSKRFMNDPMTGKRYNMIPSLAYYRVQDKPFFVSEWDDVWPNEWRAESPLLMAAVGAMQGWGGFDIHTYRYTLEEDVDMIAKPVTADALNGVYYRGGSFDTFNDPAKYGLFYHAALIFRRGDVRPAEKTLNVQPVNINTEYGPSWELVAEKHRVETVLPGVEPKGDIVISNRETYIGKDETVVLSDTRELYRNLTKQIGWIDSPKTKAVYGFVGREGNIELTGMKINVKTDFATVAISSLTDEPIQGSTNMLLTAVGRAENTDMKYNADRNQVLDVGHGPIRVEIIEATIEIETDQPDLRVMSINPQGMITGYMPSEYKDGIFRFEIGQEFQSIYYLIQNL